MRNTQERSTTKTATLLSTEDAARYIGMAARTLHNWRWIGTGIGPAFVRMGRSVRYDVRTLDAWIAARTFESTSAADAARANRRAV
jgi:hypothetical protein